MTSIIARKEMLEMLRDGRFRAASVIVLTLLVAALALGVVNYRQVRREQAEAQARDRDTWLAQGEKNPHSAAHFGKYAFKPSPPLAFLDRGLNSYTGVAIWMEAHYQNSARNRPAEDQTSAGRFGELTAATVLQLLIPLVVILLAFAAFAGERESGTLRQLLSLGVRRESLTVGKAAGVAVALLVLLVPATLVGLLALSFAATRGDALPTVGRFFVLTITYLLYFGIVLGLTLAASAFFRSSRTALVALLGFWIFSCLVAPRVAADASEKLYPTTSRVEFWRDVNREMREGMDGHNPADRRREELRQRVVAQYGVEKVEDLPVNFSGIALQAGEEFGDTVFDRHYGRLWQNYARQNRVHEAFAAVAPLISIRGISMGVAGTDWPAHQDFARAAEDYRRALQRQLNYDLTHGSRTGQTYLADADLWRQALPFEYEQFGLGRVLSNHAVSLALLVVWFVAATTLAYFAAKRMAVD